MCHLVLSAYFLYDICKLNKYVKKRNYFVFILNQCLEGGLLAPETDDKHFKSGALFNWFEYKNVLLKIKRVCDVAKRKRFLRFF